MKYLLPIAILLLMGSQECGNPYDEEPGFQTEILEVRTVPDTLAIGDTATFYCIIEDSLDTSFEYSWSIHEDDIVPVNGRTDSSVIKWSSERYIGLADSGFEKITFYVSVSNGDDILRPVSKDYHLILNYK